MSAGPDNQCLFANPVCQLISEVSDQAFFVLQDKKIVYYTERLKYFLPDKKDPHINDLLENVDEHDIDLLKNNSKKIIEGMDGIYELFIRSKKDKKIYRVNIYKSQWDNNPAFLVKISDVSRNRNLRLRFKEEKERASFYLDLITHDISNDMQALIGWLQYIEMKYDTNRENTKEINEIINKSLSLLHSYKTLSTINREDYLIMPMNVVGAVENEINRIDPRSNSLQIKNEMSHKRINILADDLLGILFEQLLNLPLFIDKDMKITVTSKKAGNNIRIKITGKGEDISEKMNIILRMDLNHLEFNNRSHIGLLISKLLVDRYNGSIKFVGSNKNNKPSTCCIVDFPIYKGL